MEMEGGGTVRLRGGAEMGTTVLVGIVVRLKDTLLAGSAEEEERALEVCATVETEREEEGACVPSFIFFWFCGGCC